MSANGSFSHLAQAASRHSGRASTFALALAVVLAWAASGPLFGWSDTWQLVINTGTTIITFLMVFLIQNTQNRDGAALQTKLDELIRVGEAENRFIGIEHLSESEVEQFRKLCEKAAAAHENVQKANAGKVRTKE